MSVWGYVHMCEEVPVWRSESWSYRLCKSSNLGVGVTPGSSARAVNARKC